MTKWEYLSKRGDPDDALGSQGWELVSVVVIQGHQFPTYSFYKRPKG